MSVALCINTVLQIGCGWLSPELSTLHQSMAPESTCCHVNDIAVIPLSSMRPLHAVHVKVPNLTERGKHPGYSSVIRASLIHPVPGP